MTHTFWLLCGLIITVPFQLSDLILDTPEAPTVIGNFMARSLVLPPVIIPKFYSFARIMLPKPY